MRTFIIAEAGVNHNGQEDLAFALVDAAAKSGADAIKFQTFSADKLVRKGADRAEYQKNAMGEGDQYSMLKALEMSADLHRRLFQRCIQADIEFMSTPFDEEAAAFLVELGMKRIKIPSGEIVNEPFLDYLARFGLPLILSTGMADMAEIERAVSVVREVWQGSGSFNAIEDNLTILHCTSNYPAAFEDVNLRAMMTIHRETGFPVGYSDHTQGLGISTAAVALGASVIEKHFTLDRSLPGPDHQASLTVPELAALIGQIRAVERALGSSIKAPVENELAVRSLVRRSVTSIRNLKAGDALSSGDVALMRPGDGIVPAEMVKVLGRHLVRDIPAGVTLHWSDLV